MRDEKLLVNQFFADPRSIIRDSLQFPIHENPIMTRHKTIAVAWKNENALWKSSGRREGLGRNLAPGLAMGSCVRRSDRWLVSLWSGMEELVEESSLVWVVSLAACALALLATLCIVCHRKRHRRRRPNVVSRERRPFAPASCPGLESSRPSLSLPSEVPPAPSLFTSLPPLSIDSADHVWKTGSPKRKVLLPPRRSLSTRAK